MSTVQRLPEHDILEFSKDSLLYIGQTFSGREMWLDRDDMSRHALVVGTTGSGKTEMLLSMAASSIFSGNGLVFVDGKGDVSTFAKIYALAAKVGRSDDIMLLNFGAQPKSGPATTHTMNPLKRLSADAIEQIIVAMLPVAGRDGEMWKGRAIAMLSALIGFAVWQRDCKGIPLTFSRLRERLSLEEFVAIATNRWGDYEGMPEAVREPVQRYLEQLPGYVEGKALTATSRDQHGFLTMQLTRIFSTMSDSFGHVFDVVEGEVDMEDVVRNRRILVVLLPSLAKSASEISNVGGIVVTLIKNMMSEALIAPIEGPWDQVVENRSTSGSDPVLVVFDEASYYVTPGMGAMAGQARSLGFSLVFATQDLGVLEAANLDEYRSIVANTNLKIYMSMEHPGDHRLSTMLPSQTRLDNLRGEAEELISAEIGVMREEMISMGGAPEDRYGLREGQQDGVSARQDRILSLLRDRLALVRDNPNWTLNETLKGLRPGEFVVVKKGQFQRGRGVFVSGSLACPDIFLPRGVVPVIDEVGLDDRHLRPQRRKNLVEQLQDKDFDEAMKGLQAMSLDLIDRGIAGKDAEAVVRRGFALLFGYQNLKPGAPNKEIYL